MTAHIRQQTDTILEQPIGWEQTGPFTRGAIYRVVPLAPGVTADGKIVLTHTATGAQIERWPIDARGQIASGEYTTEAAVFTPTERNPS